MLNSQGGRGGPDAFFVVKAVVRPQVGQQRLLGGLGRFGAAAVNDITGVVSALSRKLHASAVHPGVSSLG